MTFQIALVQFKPVRRDVKANIKKVRDLLNGISADLVVLPELANSGYLYENHESIKPFAEVKGGNGDFLSSLIDLATSTKGIIVSGYAEVEGDQVFNSAAVVSDNGVIENYRKTHLFADEKIIFKPGNSGFKVFEWLGVKIGMMICFDWIFPESARTLALDGAQIIAHPANLVLPYCQEAMITRSIENRVFTITANRIGCEKLGKDHLQFTGSSQMTSPKGEILYRGPINKETVHITTIDPEQAHNKRISATNDLFDDRRPEFYKLSIS
jgi:predicted amidohydrolase